MKMDNLLWDWKIDEGDSVYILGRSRIQVAQPTYESTAGFQRMTNFLFVYYSTVLLWVLFHSDAVSIVTVTDYLAVGPSLAPDIWTVVLGLYGTHLKHRQCF